MTKIGIISKEAHAKSHVRVLRERGYNPIVLGGEATSIPPSLDVLVCRVASCSHTASALAQRTLREGHMPVIFENGISEILSALENLEAKTPTAKAQPVTVNDEIHAALVSCGIFSPKLLSLPVHQAADFLVSLGVIRGNKAKDKAKRALTVLSQRDYFNVRRLMKRHTPPVGVNSSGEEFHVEMMSYVTERSKQTNVEPVFWIGAVSDSALDLYAKKFEFFRAGTEAPETETPEPQTEAPETETETVTADEAIAGMGLTDEPVPTETETPNQNPVIPEADVATSPALLIEVASEPELPKADPLEEIRAALSLLHENMGKLGFKLITIDDAGKVSFTRVIVEEGTLSL